MTKKYLHLIIFAAVTLIIISPLLAGKYVMTLDTIISPSAWHGVKSFDFMYGVWTDRPNQDELGLTTARIPLFIVSIWLQFIFPTFILQKIEIFLIFFLAMLSMYSLVKTNEIPRYFAAFLYAVNPFTYTRFMAGHWTLLLGYAILPFFINELLKKELKIKNIVLWLSLIAILSMHILAMCFLALAVFIKKPIKKYLWIAILFILLNIYWIYPAFTANYTTLTTITSDDTNVYESRNHFANILFTNAMMYGFWRANAYIMPSIFLTIPLFIIILYLAVHGAIYSKVKQKNRFILLAFIFLVNRLG